MNTRDILQPLKVIRSSKEKAAVFELFFLIKLLNEITNYKFTEDFIFTIKDRLKIKFSTLNIAIRWIDISNKFLFFEFIGNKEHYDVFDRILKENITSFKKKNNEVKEMLDGIFPNELYSIILEYSKNIITTDIETIISTSSDLSNIFIIRR
jgi:hypothetical protein